MRISISKLIPIRFTKYESLIFQYCFEYIPLQYEMVFVGQFRWPIIKVQCTVKFFIMTMYSEMKWFTQAQNHGFSGLSRDVLLKAKLQTRQTYLYVHLDLSPSLTFSCLCFCVLAYHISKFSMKNTIENICNYRKWTQLLPSAFESLYHIKMFITRLTMF